MGGLSQKLILHYQKLFQFGALTGPKIQCVAHRFASEGNTAKTGHASSRNPSDVPGLSSAVYRVPDGNVGPGASKGGEYKNPEYFCYNRMSYFEAEIEMSKYRLPQPSNKSKKN